MPIKDQPVGPRFTRLGIIRLGDRKKSNQPGQATPYFQFRDAPELAQWYDDQPTQLNVFWPFNDVDRNVDDAYRLYGAGSIKCRGDGEIMDTCLKGADFVVSGGVCIKAFSENGEGFKPGDIVPCKGPGEAGCYPKCAECKIISYFKVMIREAMEAGYFGYYQVGSGSTSKHGRVNIRGALEAVRELVRFLTGSPAIAGIPMILSLKTQSIPVPLHDKSTGEGYRARMDKSILHLVPHPDWMKAQTSVMLEQAYQPLARLPAPAAQLPPPLAESSRLEPAETIRQTSIEEGPREEGKLDFEEAEFTEVSTDAKAVSISNWGELWMAIYQDFELDRSKALEALGVADQSELNMDYDEIYHAVETEVRGALGNSADMTKGAPDIPDSSDIKTHEQCWKRVFQDFELDRSRATEIAGLTDAQLATLHPADIYVKVWMAVQAGEAIEGTDPPNAAEPSTAAKTRQVTPSQSNPFAMRIKAMRNKLIAAVKAGRSGPMSTKQFNLLMIILKEVFGEDDKEQKLFLCWVFDYDTADFSRKNLSQAEASAFLDELNLTLEGNKYISTRPDVVDLYRQMLRQAKLEHGQIDMFDHDTA